MGCWTRRPPLSPSTPPGRLHHKLPSAQQGSQDLLCPSGKASAVLAVHQLSGSQVREARQGRSSKHLLSGSMVLWDAESRRHHL